MGEMVRGPKGRKEERRARVVTRAAGKLLAVQDHGRRQPEVTEPVRKQDYASGWSLDPVETTE